MSSGRSISPKWIWPGAGAHEDDAPLDAVVDVVPARSPSSTPVSSLVRRADVLLGAGSAACPGISSIPVIDSKTWCAKTIQRHVHLARADRRPSPSRGRRPARSRGTSRCRSARRPSTAPASSGVGQVGLEPGERRARRSASGRCRGPRTRTRPAPARGCARAAVAPGVVRRSRKANVVGRVRDRVQLGEHLDGRVLEPPLVLRATRRRASCRRSCRAARPAGRRRRSGPSGRTACRAPRRSARSSATAGHGHVGAARRRSASRRTGPGARSSRRPGGPRATARRGRRTRPCCCSPSSVQVASRISVSEDIPLASMPLCSVTFGSAPVGQRAGQPGLEQRPGRWRGRGWSAGA